MSNKPVSTQANLSALPSVDHLLRDTRFTDLSDQYGREILLAEVRVKLGAIREQLPASDESLDRDSITDQLHHDVSMSLQALFAPSLKKVINLTGVILHTNLGRAPYPQAAIDAMIEVSGACNLEFNLSTGKRGRRDDHVERWLCELTGAEAATTVNNNAAAVLLTLNSLAFGKNVIVSRGELIEIGGSFRIPAIMKKAGCKLREVGTTNRTHAKDYQEAIGKKTAALMKVHTSNYEINGFTKSVSATELAKLAAENNIPLIDDLGSGTIVDPAQFGLPYERTVREALKDGADVITFSGDKLLGGPQCGVIAGRRDLIAQIDKNPIKRAMRLDKLTLAALEAVLKLYANPDQLLETIPSLQMLARKSAEIESSASELQHELQALLPALTVSFSPCQSQIGSGALPTNTIDSYAVVIQGNDEFSADKLAATLRSLTIPVIGRVSKNALWLDCRSLLKDSSSVLIRMLKAELSGTYTS